MMSPPPEPSVAKSFRMASGLVGGGGGGELNSFLSAIRWAEEPVGLRDFGSLPQVAKIVKGQYLGIGTPSIGSPSLQSLVFLSSSGGKKVKVAAQCVKFKEATRKVVPVGPKLTIPDNYEGWFEILSEDGRAIRCIESVAELARRFPETCLVRENIKAFRGDEMEISEKCRTLQAGETLVLVGETITTPGKNNKLMGRYLRCFTSKGDPVYLGFDQKGKFSPIAGEANISGVHSIEKLLTKRFPLMVRLVHGKPPTGFKSHFVPEMRLYSLVEEESIVAIPLLKDTGAVVLPANAPLKVLGPKNSDAISKHKEFSKLVEKSKTLLLEVSNKIHVYDVYTNKDLKKENVNIHKRSHKLFHQVNMVRRSHSVPDSSIKSPNVERALSSPSHLYDSRYDEIDLIYDYVRGFAPLPETIKNEFSVDEDNSKKPTAASSPEEIKPEPPPIETIPARKCSLDGGGVIAQSSPKITVSIINSKQSSPSQSPLPMEHHVYEKINKPGEETTHPEKRVAVRSMSAGKIFLPSGHHVNHNKIFIRSSGQHQKSSKSRFAKHAKTNGTPVQRSPLQKSPVVPDQLSTSPLFNIRYKSLTNLAFNTLDSSNSGGQVSSGSGGSLELVDRNRKLPRPKSLCNLFWTINPSPPETAKVHPQHQADGRKFIFSRDVFKPSSKRLGTLYL